MSRTSSFFVALKGKVLKACPTGKGNRNGKAVSRGVKLFTCLPATLLLSACSFGPIAAPEVSHYFLQGAPADMHHIISAKHVSILVAPIVSAPGYETSAMHYVLTPYQLQSFVKHASESACTIMAAGG